MAVFVCSGNTSVVGHLQHSVITVYSMPVSSVLNSANALQLCRTLNLFLVFELLHGRSSQRKHVRSTCPARHPRLNQNLAEADHLPASAQCDKNQTTPDNLPTLPAVPVVKRMLRKCVHMSGPCVQPDDSRLG